MKHAFYLALRYLASAPGRSAVLVFGLTVAFFLPIFTFLATERLEETLLARAEASPILLGRRGDAFDLTLASLYFRGEAPEAIPYGLIDEVETPGYGLALPLHLGHSASSVPILGTVPEYFEARGLSIAQGRLPVVIGEVVVGAEAGRRMGLEVGDRLRSDLANLYDLAGAYPLLLEVVGILRPTAQPDDDALFSSLETAWALDGLFHGHEEVSREAPATLVAAPPTATDIDTGTDTDTNSKTTSVPADSGEEEGSVEENLEASAAIFLFTEIDDRNRGSFHLHGPRSEAPITSILVLPSSRRHHDQLLGDLALDERYQAVRPSQVVRSIFDLVLRLRTALEAYFVLVALSTGAFVALVILLSLRLRREELHLLRRLGAGRSMLAALVGAEIFLVALAAGVLTTVATWGGLTILERLL